MRILLLLVAAW